MFLLLSSLTSGPLYSLNLKDHLTQSYINFCNHYQVAFKSKKAAKLNRNKLGILSVYTDQTRVYTSNELVRFDQISGSLDPNRIFDFSPGNETFTINKNGTYIIRILGVAQGSNIKYGVFRILENDLSVVPVSPLLSLPGEAIITISKAPLQLGIRLFSDNSTVFLESGCSLTIQQL